MTRFGLPALLLALSVSLAGCGSDGGDDVATDPGSDSGAGYGSGSGPADEIPPPKADAPDAPSEAPAAPGDVRSQNLVTVMDADTGDDLVELCLGAVAESYPPQCGGPAITNWDWDTYGQAMFDEQGTVRWGMYAVTGTWDGSEFTVSEAIPAALYDPMVPSPTELPDPVIDYSEAALEDISTMLMELPGAQGAYYDDGHVFLDVTYDDGSYQEYADGYFGAGVVIVNGALVDVTA